MSQDQTIATFTTLATTQCNTLIGQLLTYHSAIAANLFECAVLDEEHRLQLVNVDRSRLIALRNRLDAFYTTLRQAIAAGSN